MNKLLMLISTMTIMCPAYLMAENMMPPAGPYNSIEGEMSSFSHERNNTAGMHRQIISDHEQEKIPEWVKQRQIEMNNWHKMQADQASRQRLEQPMFAPPPLHQGNTQAMQWNQRQAAPMNGAAQKIPPQAINPQLSQPQMNRMKQYFPASRGPVYGPNVPPPENFNNPGYQNRPPVNQYPPMWR